ncbi:MAG: hypothetical protein KF725_13700 [Cyclobacteriaceae bacterium]|nr:hypothetical protein [Cyclobacteriaceae bacterium]
MEAEVLRMNSIARNPPQRKAEKNIAFCEVVDLYYLAESAEAKSSSTKPTQMFHPDF